MNSRNIFFIRVSNKTAKLLLSTVFLSLCISDRSVEAYPTRKEAAAEYKSCEKQEDLISKIRCMESLRISLGDYGESSYSGYLDEKSDRELRAIYRKERKRAQVKIARLPINK